MGMWWVLVFFFGLGMLLAKDRRQRRRFLEGVRAWILLPVGAVLTHLRQLK